MYTPEQIEQIERHHNWVVRQDADGNLTWNNSATAETGWRTVSQEQINAAFGMDREGRYVGPDADFLSNVFGL